MISLRSVLLSTALLGLTLLLSAENSPLLVGAADVAAVPDVHLSSGPGFSGLSLEQAFELEAVEQLDLPYIESSEPSELERLQQENARLQVRVAELERRLSAVEAKLK
jgi:hypothetical protein